MAKVLWGILLVGLIGFARVAHAGQSGELVCVHSHMVYGDPGGMVCDTDELRVHITTDADVGRPGAFGIGVQTVDGRTAAYTVGGGWVGFKGGLEEPADGYFQSLPASRDYVIYHGDPAGICALSQGQNFSLWAGHGALSVENEAKVNVMSANAARLSAVSRPATVKSAEYLATEARIKGLSGSGGSMTPEKAAKIANDKAAGKTGRDAFLASNPSVNTSVGGNAALQADHMRAMYIQMDGTGNGTGQPAKGGAVYYHNCSSTSSHD